MEIRKVTPDDDFEAIGDIYAKSWKAAYRGIVPQSYLDELDGSRWSSALADSKYDGYVVMDGDRYAGTSFVAPARDEAMAGWGEIISVYLLPEYYGKGYAAPLFEKAVAALNAKGFERIYLWVLAENSRAQRFYEKHEFHKNGDSATLTIAGKELTEVRYVRQEEETEFVNWKKRSFTLQSIEEVSVSAETEKIDGTDTEGF